MLSRLEPLRKFVHTLRRHQDAVLAFIGTRVTNAIAEGLNRIVKIVKNRASGFRHLDAFSDMIYLTVGGLDTAWANSSSVPHTMKTSAQAVRSSNAGDQPFARSGYSRRSDAPVASVWVAHA